jgi:homopolymeric O-antigen transport system ATP-binding protein
MKQRIELLDVSKCYPVWGLLGMRPLPPIAARMSRSRNIALDRVSLTIETGERIGIVGRNGAGKTTLLKVMAGLAPPTSGVASVQGRVTAIMTLGLAIREDLTGRENVYVEAEVQGRTRAETDAIIDDVIAFADLGEFIDYPVRTYSTGMKARLAFAAATHIDPDVLIIDEALSVGDAAFAVKAKQMVRRLCERGRIVVIVSHAMNAIVDLCTRCLWMEAGRIVMDGDPLTVTEAYVTAVRREDDAALLARFKDLEVSRSYRPGCEIRELSICEEGEVPRAIIRTGREARVRWSATLSPGTEAAFVRFEVVRLDGLVVIDAERALIDMAVGDRAFGGYIGMRPVVLGPGVYRCRLAAHTPSQVVAERAIVIEVVATDMPRGGRSALLYPSAVAVEAIV